MLEALELLRVEIVRIKALVEKLQGAKLYKRAGVRAGEVRRLQRIADMFEMSKV